MSTKPGPAPASKVESRTSTTTAAGFDEARYRLLVESVSDYAIFMLDPDGFVQTWNAGAERIKGYAASEIIGQHFSIFYLDDDVERHHPARELEIADGVGRYEEEGWRLRKDGTRFWANIVLTALREADGTLVGYAKVTRDLTERRLAEEALRRSEQRNRLMFESAKDYGIFMLNPKGFVDTWNEGARRIKGYEAEEIIGKHFSIFYTDNDIQMGKCEFELEQAALTGRFEDEGWRKRKDGTLFWANVVINAVRDPDQILLGYVKVTRDITDRRQAEEKLRLALEHTEKRVLERTHALEEANTRLQEAVSARDDFLSIASHELRTPLTPLNLQLQALALQLSKPGQVVKTERVASAVASCEKAVGRLSNLIDNLLDVSRISTGGIRLSTEDVNVGTLVGEVVERHRAEATAMGIDLTLNCPAVVRATLDHFRIEQVVTNLLINAFKYGGRTAVQLGVDAANGQVSIFVRDHGPGISAPDQARVFQKFERGKLNHAVGGMGLGLYITKQIIESHGGTIGVTSVEGEGACFTVTFPANYTMGG